MIGNKAIVTQLGGYAIGDTIYANIGLRYLSEKYHKIYIYHPIPDLISNIPNLSYVDPLNFTEDVFIPKSTESNVWAKHFFRDAEKLFRPMDVRFDDKIDVYTALQMGEGLREGHSYPEEMISGDVMGWIQGDNRKHKLFTPDPYDHEVKEVSLWMSRVGIDIKNPIVMFHPTWKVEENNGRLPARSAKDHEASKVFRAIGRVTQNFVDTDVVGHRRFTAFPNIPTMPVSGPYGLRYTKALIQLCDGVVMQESCRLLPFAQSLNKPILCMNRGSNSLRSLNWNRFDHRPFMELEPDEIHYCVHPCNPCDICDKNPIPHNKIKSQTDLFIDQVLSAYKERRSSL